MSKTVDELAEEFVENYTREVNVSRIVVEECWYAGYTQAMKDIQEKWPSEEEIGNFVLNERLFSARPCCDDLNDWLRSKVLESNDTDSSKDHTP